MNSIENHEKKFVNYYKRWLTKFNPFRPYRSCIRRTLYFIWRRRRWIDIFFLLGGNKAFSQNDMIDPFDFVAFTFNSFTFFSYKDWSYFIILHNSYACSYYFCSPSLTFSFLRVTEFRKKCCLEYSPPFPCTHLYDF